MAVITQCSAPEETVVAAGGQLVVNTGDVPIVGGGNRTAEAKSDKIVVVAKRQIVGFRESIEVVQHDRVGSDPQRIHGSQVVRCQRLKTSGRTEAGAGDRSAWALGGCGTLVKHDPLA